MATTNDLKTTRSLDRDEIARLKWAWKTIADQSLQRTRPGAAFTIDDTNRDVVDGLFWWFFNDPRSRYDLHRGLLIKGGPGSGKTTLVNAFREFHKRVSRGFVFDSATTIALEYARTGNLERWLKPHVLAIDEVGMEKSMRHYGNELNVIAYLLHERYARWQQRGDITIITTNLDSDGMQAICNASERFCLSEEHAKKIIYGLRNHVGDVTK